jgi:hypothetical protein
MSILVSIILILLNLMIFINCVIMGLSRLSLPRILINSLLPELPEEDGSANKRNGLTIRVAPGLRMYLI